ncbi:MAG: 3-methylcrotonyl-CoA carboxylase, partial [Rhodobacteraceae bacterium]|nr:3-methylcrotonyl-CoA carboxylase [Paracoccaceae bacterium]
LSFPDGARADSGVRQGDTISPWYDPMIAKLVVHGPNRGAALNQLERALRHTDVGGLTTNISFLSALAAQPDFKVGDMDTGLIARHIDTLTPTPVACTKVRSIAALTALGLWDNPNVSGFTLWQPLIRDVTLTHLDQDITARVSTNGPQDFTVELPEVSHRVVRRDGTWWCDTTRVLARVAVSDDEITVFWGNGYRFVRHDPAQRETDGIGDGNLIQAPMPGLVKLINAQPGQTVTSGDRLAVLEAMKMEHSLLAARDGVVAEVLVKAGDQVEAGAALVRLEADDG